MSGPVSDDFGTTGQWDESQYVLFSCVRVVQASPLLSSRPLPSFSFTLPLKNAGLDTPRAVTNQTGGREPSQRSRGGDDGDDDGRCGALAQGRIPSAYVVFSLRSRFGERSLWGDPAH